MVFLLAMMLMFGMAFAAGYAGLIIQVNETPSGVSNFSWNAGSTGNTYVGQWNFSSYFSNVSIWGGSVSLIMTPNSNCTASQTTWDFTGKGLDNTTNKSFTLTCGVNYASGNYNFSVIVNGSGPGGLNATNTSWVDVAQVNVTVVDPVFTVGNRAQSTQGSMDCITAGMPVSASAVSSQATQVAVRCTNTGSEGCTVNIRDFPPTTCYTWISSNNANYVCYSTSTIASGGSANVPVQICSQGDGSATLSVLMGDVNSTRNTTLTQTITFEHRTSSGALAAIANQQGGATTPIGTATVGSSKITITPLMIGLIVLFVVFCIVIAYFLTNSKNKRRR